MDNYLPLDPPLPPIHKRLPRFVLFVRAILSFLPSGVKHSLFRSIARIGHRRRWAIHPGLYHLPFGLLLKRSVRDQQNVEAAALQFLESSGISGVNFPFLVGACYQEDISYTIMTYIPGENAGLVAELFSPQDWKRLEVDLGEQLQSLRCQTSTQEGVICNAAGGIIDDPRFSWVIANGIRLATSQDFFTQVWCGLDLPRNRDTIRPFIQSIIERPTLTAFCHGDVCLRNFILPGGLSAWRSGRSRLCLIDWEFAGWMPEPWEALKSTFGEHGTESNWIPVVKRMLPGNDDYLEADWLWFFKSGMMTV